MKAKSRHRQPLGAHLGQEQPASLKLPPLPLKKDFFAFRAFQVHLCLSETKASLEVRQSADSDGCISLTSASREAEAPGPNPDAFFVNGASYQNNSSTFLRVTGD